MTRHWIKSLVAGSLFDHNGVQRTMLKPFDNQESIPEALREHYSKREDGKWHADISDDHPAVKHNAKLLSEKSTAEGKVTKLESDLESARAGNLGRGQTAISTSDAKLLDQYKALGTPDEVGTKLAQGKTDAEELATRTRSETLRKVAKAHNYNEDAFALLSDLPDFVSRPSKDGKATEWFAQIKDDKGVITEKPVKEFVESSEKIKPFMASLTAKSDGVRVPTTGPTTIIPENDPHKWAKEYAKNYVEQSQPVADPFKAFSERSSV